MGWMSKVCDEWEREELLAMDENDMVRLVGFYESGRVPSFEQIRLGEDHDQIWSFDGSFGWT